LGARPEVFEAIHSYGGICLHDVINNRFAKKAIEKGADGLICVAAGAGGHAGTLSPMAFIQEVREWFDGPVLLSGAISTGDGVLAAQAMGADLAYLGSAFIATEEANADEGYKKGIVENAVQRISSIPTCSPAFTATTCDLPSRLPGLDPDDLPESDPSNMNFGSGGSSKAESLERYLGLRSGYQCGESGITRLEN
jgi:nitronate monooxygenase